MPDHDPEVTPEQEARVRHLLGQARHRDPVPLDLVARLDRVLEQLAAEGTAGDPHRGIVDLAARRRRRVTTLLVAAAAVVVVGVGVAQVLPSSQQDASMANGGGADESVEGASSSQDRDAPDPGLSLDDSVPEVDDQSSANEPGAAASEGGYGTPPRRPIRLTDEGFARQVVRYRDRPGIQAFSGSVVPGSALSRSQMYVCEAADWGEGRLLAALYDDVPAVLVYRVVAGETQTVDLLRCGSGEVLRSTVLPVDG